MVLNSQSIEHRRKFLKKNLKRAFLNYAVDGNFKSLENLNAYLQVLIASYAR